MSDLKHGNILVSEGGFNFIGRYDEHDYPLKQVRLISIPLGTQTTSRSRDMDENLLQAAIDAGEMIVIDRDDLAEVMTHPDAAADFERLPLHWRGFFRLPRTKPSVGDLRRKGLIINGAELGRRMADGKERRFQPRT